MYSKLDDLDVKDRNNSALPTALHEKLGQISNSRKSGSSHVEKNSGSLFRTILMAFETVGLRTLSEPEIFELCLALKINDLEKKDLIRTIKSIFIFSDDNPTVPANFERFVYQTSVMRSEEEILMSRRRRKFNLMNRSAYLLERMLQRNATDVILTTFGKLRLYVDIEKAAESQDAFELAEARRLARPHVIERNLTSFVCIFCRFECVSIIALQAHLISQKHHFLKLPRIWENAINKMREYELSGTNSKTTSKSVFASMFPFSRVFSFDPEGKIEEAASIDDRTDTDIDKEHGNKNAEMEGIDNDGTTLIPVVAHYTACLFCGTTVNSAELLEGHYCTNQVGWRQDILLHLAKLNLRMLEIEIKLSQYILCHLACITKFRDTSGGWNSFLLNLYCFVLDC